MHLESSTRFLERAPVIPKEPASSRADHGRVVGTELRPRIRRAGATSAGDFGEACTQAPVRADPARDHEHLASGGLERPPGLGGERLDDRLLEAAGEVEIPEAQRARSAAYVITASEGASLHLERLRKQANDFDPAVRDRLIAGAMIPAAMVPRSRM